MTRSIILLSGPVGAGKTTVARELVASSPGPSVYIEGDTFWFFIVKSTENEDRAKNFKTVMSSMLAAAVPYANAGYEVIVDFSIPPWFLNTARKIAAVRNIPLHYVVLRPAKTICAERAASRPTGAITDYAPYDNLYTSFDEAGSYTIQDDTSDAPTIAALIRYGLNAGKFHIS